MLCSSCSPIGSKRGDRYRRCQPNGFSNNLSLARPERETEVDSDQFQPAFDGNPYFSSGRCHVGLLPPFDMGAWSARPYLLPQPEHPVQQVALAHAPWERVSTYAPRGIGPEERHCTGTHRPLGPLQLGLFQPPFSCRQGHARANAEFKNKKKGAG